MTISIKVSKSDKQLKLRMQAARKYNLHPWYIKVQFVAQVVQVANQFVVLNAPI